MLIDIGNMFYQSVQDDFLLLRIDIELLEPKVVWEAPAPVGEIQTDKVIVDRDMPHIYGELHHKAVDKEYKVIRGENGQFMSIEGMEE